jgi:hypothetical protein
MGCTQNVHHPTPSGTVLTPTLTRPLLRYHAAMRAVCEKHDVLIMGDEVITGLGRTGHFWGCQHPTVAQSPDLLSCAKQLTSAYLPLSATFVPPYLVEALDDATRRSKMVLGHGYTYSGAHPLFRTNLQTAERSYKRLTTSHPISPRIPHRRSKWFLAMGTPTPVPMSAHPFAKSPTEACQNAFKNVLQRLPHLASDPAPAGLNGFRAW